MLRDLYDKYAAQGFEIYQVSLDADEHYWKTTADNLPWICVRDGNGIYSSIAASYNAVSYTHLDVYKRQLSGCCWPDRYRRYLPPMWFRTHGSHCRHRL